MIRRRTAPLGTGPRRTVRAATGWGVLYGGFGLACVLTGTPLFGRAGDPGPVGLGWIVVAVGALAASACTAVHAYGPRPVLRSAVWTACGLAAAGAFSLLMDVITLLFGQGVDSRASAVQHALAGAGAVLLAAVATTTGTTGTTGTPGTRAGGADSIPAGAGTGAGGAVRAGAGTGAGGAVRAGAGTGAALPGVPPEPSAASWRVQLAAWAGTAAFVPYAAMKLVWVLGGTFAGVSGAEVRAASRRNGASGLWLALEAHGVDATVLLAGLGTFLLWGLVRPWGMRFPRWTPLLRGRRVPRRLPLAPALLGAATLAPYGALGLAYQALATAGAVPVRRGDFPTAGDALLAGWIGVAAFAVYGSALAVAARSYWLRTRPRRPARR
nr:hypothetical protein [Streptomyces albus]